MYSKYTRVMRKCRPRLEVNLIAMDILFRLQLKLFLPPLLCTWMEYDDEPDRMRNLGVLGVIVRCVRSW